MHFIILFFNKTKSSLAKQPLQPKLSIFLMFNLEPVNKQNKQIIGRSFLTKFPQN